MPLSEPGQPRDPVHARAVECRSYRRADGMWDVEGHLTDVKSYSFRNRFRGEVRPGEPIHDMRLRLTVDADYVVREVEAATDAGPYESCPAILPAFQKLKGMRIGPGWRRAVRRELGGVQGCTHLVDLLDPIATVALHTVRWSGSAPADRGRRPPEKPAPPLDACHVWAADGELVRTEYPEHHRERGARRPAGSGG